MRAVGVLTVGLIICGLAFLVAYLLSDINQRRFRTRQSGDILLIEQGRFFPVGFVPYQPDTQALARAYAPILLPPHENVGPSTIYEDRGTLDRALFTLLSGWARSRLDASDEPTLELASLYVQRAEMLPGIAEQQRHALRGLRADAALRQAQSLVQQVGRQLRHAQASYQLALEMGTEHADEARAGLAAVRQKLQRLEQVHPEPQTQDVQEPPP
jgi:hypothetical protein